MFRTPQVILFSQDLPRTVAFYSSLGFEETFRVPADPQYGPHCFATYWLDHHGFKLEAVCHSPEER